MDIEELKNRHGLDPKLTTSYYKRYIYYCLADLIDSHERCWFLCREIRDHLEAEKDIDLSVQKVSSYLKKLRTVKSKSIDEELGDELGLEQFNLRKVYSIRNFL